jgi:FAD/FMN-containing dehydrogenase
MTATPTEFDFQPLSAAVRGRLLRPGDDGWDAARQAWNLAADLHPAAVIFAEGAADIAAAARFANERDLRVTAQGTGHGACALGDLSDTVLVKTVRMAGVEIDRERRVARVEAGALWGDVVVDAAEAGLAALHGSALDVAAVGYTLGGGIGWVAREHGLACNKVTAIDVVTADGEQRRVDAASEPDLFWAMRGGGGSFALVAAIEFELLPIVEAHAGMLVWPGERGAEILDVWRAWTRDLPDAITSSFRWLQLPPLPEVPEPLRGRPTVAITAAYDGPAREAAELLAPLRALGATTLDSFATIPAADLRRLNGDPEVPTPAHAAHALLADLGDETASRLWAAAGPDARTPLVAVELRHLGGALARVPEGAGALGRLDGEFLLFAFGVPMGLADGPVIQAALDTVLDAVAPSANGSYLNFAETPIDTATAFSDATWRRLRAIKAAVDPANTIRSNHPVDPAAS